MYTERNRFNDVFAKEVYEHLWDKLITCNGLYHLSQVEISFRWEIKGETVMQRFTRFNTKEEFLAACSTGKPHTIQLGGVLPGFPGNEYDSELGMDRSSRERDRALCRNGITSARGPLVIDIDLTDYDRRDICACGLEHKCCNACFAAFMPAAMDILNYILRDLFQFKKVFFVWSGCRGIHTWVTDESVSLWTSAQRTVFITRISQLGSDPRVQEILQAYPQACFPKFDVDVSKTAEHLKKLPMAIHQTTSYLCIPLPEGNRFKPENHSRRPMDVSVDLLRVFCDSIKL